MKSLLERMFDKRKRYENRLDYRMRKKRENLRAYRLYEKLYEKENEEI